MNPLISILSIVAIFFCCISEVHAGRGNTDSKIHARSKFKQSKRNRISGYQRQTKARRKSEIRDDIQYELEDYHHSGAYSPIYPDENNEISEEEICGYYELFMAGGPTVADFPLLTTENETIASNTTVSIHTEGQQSFADVVREPSLEGVFTGEVDFPPLNTATFAHNPANMMILNARLSYSDILRRNPPTECADDLRRSPPTKAILFIIGWNLLDRFRNNLKAAEDMGEPGAQQKLKNLAYFIQSLQNEDSAALDRLDIFLNIVHKLLANAAGSEDRLNEFLAFLTHYR